MRGVQGVRSLGVSFQGAEMNVFSELWTRLPIGMLCSMLVIHLVCNDFGCHVLLVVDRKRLCMAQ